MTRKFDGAPNPNAPREAYRPKLSLLEEVEATVVALPGAATFGDAAVVLAVLGTICVSELGREGDRAYFSGGIGASRFGRGAEQGNAAKARRLVESAPSADIAVLSGNAVVIVERATRRVRRAQQIQRF